MVGVTGTQRARRAGLLLAVLLVATPGPVAADGDESVILAETVWASTTADLDGDGEREVIAIRRHPDGADRMVVAAWGMTDGEWRSLGSSTLEHWDTESAAARPARFGREGVGLLSLRSGARTRILAATVSGASGEFGFPCCFSMSELGIGDGGLSLDLLEGSFGPAESVHVADLDGDGVDELLTGATVADEGNQAGMRYAVLRQAGDGFEAEDLPLGDPATMYLSMVGDTDGVPGDDLLFIGESGDQLVRLAAVDGELTIETASGEPFGGRPLGGWPAAAVNGLIAWVDERSVTTVRWPRGAESQIVAEVESSQFSAVFPIGDGPEARLVQFGQVGPAGEAVEPAIRIYGLDLQLEEVIDIPELTPWLWQVNNRGPLSASLPNRYLWEHLGPISGGLGPERPAVIGHGSLIELQPDGGLQVTPAAHLVGVGVAGVAGDEDGWLVVAGEWWGSGTTAYLANIGYEPTYGILGVVPLQQVAGTSGSPAPAVEMSGVTLIGSGADERLYTAGDSFELTVRAEPGDVVVAYDERRSVAEEVTGGSVTLTIEPPGRSDRNREFELTVLVIGPTGLTTGITWQAEALRVAPDVSASAEVEAFALEATVSGTVSPGATLLVDGVTVDPSPTGTFRVQVDAPIWPRDVVVIARDPIGNETVQRLEVIGFLDYRGLPWIPIVGTLTVVAGLVLFLRTPRLRPEARLKSDGDGRLEEIDGDLI